MVANSNGVVALGPESGEGWPSELNSGPASPSLEEEGRALREEEEVQRGEEERGDPALLLEGHLMESPELGIIKHNCERLSPQNLLDGPEGVPAQLDTIFIKPLDGSQAELRGRVIKEVRKPGRSESQPLSDGTFCFSSHLPDNGRIPTVTENLEKVREFCQIT